MQDARAKTFLFFFFFLVNLLSVPPMGLQLHNLGRRRKHNFPSSPVSLYVCLGTQSYLTLLRPMDCSPSGSFVHGILQTRILEWVAMPSSRESSRPQDQTWVSCIVGRLANSLRSWDTLLDKKTEQCKDAFSTNKFTHAMQF